ncbi:hypothetical protein BDR07DRAFT_450956 [Suillus spraguei]|nr:hypothetical protein BDR07DRAFT_450956 [Suillus spraguei]
MPTPSLISQSIDNILAMGSTNISIDAVTIISLSLEGILYGISIFMFLGTIYALTHNRHIRTINHPSLVVALLLLILSTAHIVINIIRTGDGLVKYREHSRRTGGVLRRCFSGHIFGQGRLVYHANPAC